MAFLQRRVQFVMCRVLFVINITLICYVHGQFSMSYFKNKV